MTRDTKSSEAVKGYNITVTGRNVHVTDAMKDYALDKVSKIERLSDRIIDVSITMDIQRIDHKCDLMMKVNHWVIKSSAVTTDMYASIDEAVHKLERQLRRHSKRLQDHQAAGVKVIDMRVNVLQRPEYADVEEINAEIERENDRRRAEKYQPHRVVAKETRPLKTLTYDEATLKLELSGDLFLLFRCESDQQLKVMYRRDDGNYAVLEPEAQ